MSAILKFLLPVTLGSIYNSAFDFLDSENIEVAVGISFLGATDAEIRLRYVDIFRNYHFFDSGLIVEIFVQGVNEDFQ